LLAPASKTVALDFVDAALNVNPLFGTRVRLSFSRIAIWRQTRDVSFSLGHRPKDSITRATSTKSALQPGWKVEPGAGSESRFQRWWIFFISRILGRSPRLGSEMRRWR
jgi:hypothetical protein